MLRIHFTSDDLARTRLATAPDPTWELVLSIQRLLERNAKIAFAPWRRTVFAAITRTSNTAPLRMLSSLVPTRSPYFPDFLTPPGSPRTLAEGLETILATPRSQLHEQLSRLDRCRPPTTSTPSWVGLLARGDLDALNRLGMAIKAVTGTTLTPYQSVINASFDADRTVRSRSLANGGVQALLAGMGPNMRWRSPVLEVDYRIDRELHLRGRGLLLVPSLFCDRYPVTLADQDLPPVLVYPVNPDPEWFLAPTGISPQRPLIALLGETRAAILEEVGAAGERTTTELARRSNTSPATISYHTRVLREAGLILTVRMANLAVHRLTGLGLALLNRRTVGVP